MFCDIILLSRDLRTLVHILSNHACHVFELIWRRCHFLRDKNPYRYDTYQRHVRDKMRVEFGVWSVVAKDTMLAMVKLVREIEDSSSSCHRLRHGVPPNGLFRDQVCESIGS